MIDDLLLKIRAKVNTAMFRQEGQSMVEYGIIVALIAVVVIALIVTLGGQLKNTFSTIVAQLNT